MFFVVLDNEKNRHDTWVSFLSSLSHPIPSHLLLTAKKKGPCYMEITQELLDEKLDCNEFAMWLRDRFTDNVGSPGAMCDCPLKNFLEQAHGILGQVEDFHFYSTSNQKPPFYLNLRPWAKNFARDLDNRYVRHMTVTGEQALVSLRDVLRHVEGERTSEEQPTEASKGSR